MALALKSGHLDRRIELHRASITTNDFNETVETFVKIADLWASKQDVSDGERWRAQQLAATDMTRFQIKWSTFAETINPKDKIVYGGKTWEILAVKELGRQQGVEITAVTRAD